MEPYYIQCIRDGPFHPTTAKGANKPEAQWSNDKRRVVNQDQRLKSIIISCLPDDIIKSAISCATAKETWTPSNSKENRIMDLKLEYNTFRAKPFESLSQTYTRYKTLLNELSNDSMKLSKHEINVGLVVKTFEWDEKEVSDNEEMTQVKVLMAFANEELAVGKNHARNGE
ncbi:hypothetical protein Tco_0833074 [Tanacetum coccineum]